jgi:hypothetical protein
MKLYVICMNNIIRTNFMNNHSMVHTSLYIYGDILSLTLITNSRWTTASEIIKWKLMILHRARTVYNSIFSINFEMIGNSSCNLISRRSPLALRSSSCNLIFSRAAHRRDVVAGSGEYNIIQNAWYLNCLFAIMNIKVISCILCE